MGAVGTEQQVTSRYWPSLRTRRLILLVALLVAAVAGIPFGLPAWLVIGVAALPWIAMLSLRSSLTLAVVSVLSAALVVMLAVMWLGPVVGLDAVAAVVVLAVVWGAVGIVCAWRSGALERAKPLPVTWVHWVGASVGGAAWMATMVAARLYPGAASVAWAMVGDSANNVIFAREVLNRGGLEFGATSNPVPLPSAVAALGMWSGRSGVDAADLTRHDVWSFSTTWAGAIVVTCLVFGLLTGALARAVTSSPVTILLASAGGSLFALTWYVTGYPIDYGFFNAHFTFALIAAAWIAYLDLDRAPARVLATLSLLSTATLAVWSPLALIPLSLAGIGFLRHARRVIKLRGAGAVGLWSSVGQLVAYVAFVSYPTYAAQSDALGAPGGAYAFRRWTVPVLAITAVVLAVLGYWRKSLAVPLGAASSSVAVLAGLGFLLASSTDADSRWTYYPLKFAWFTGVGLALVVAGLALVVVVRWGVRPWLRWPGFAAVVAATLAFALWSPTSGVGYQAINPVKKVLAGHVFGEGDEWAERVFELSNLDEGHVLWDSAEPEAEGSVNFWLLQIWSDSMSDNLDIKYFAYGLYDHGKTESLCELIDAMDAHVTVHTARQDLESDLNGVCPERDFSVVVDPTP